MSGPGSGLARRGVGLLLVLVCGGVLLIATRLEPAAAGVGTHHQLGLEPCGLLASTGVPCMTCGMTTATSLAVRGRFLAAAWTQPAGLAFACVAAVGLYLGLWMCWTAADPRPALGWATRRTVWWWVGAFVLVGWAWTAVRLRWLA